MKRQRWMMLTLAATMLAACGGEQGSELIEVVKDEAFVAPTIADPTKADAFGETVIPTVELRYGEAVTGSFVEDDQLEGYWFHARAGAIVTIDNTHLGTSAALDSTLSLYGPANEDRFFGADAIAFDDDSGWRYHARIESYEIPTDGDYLIVMGTYMGIDRGDYRLELTCEGDACEEPIVETPACDATCLVDDPCSGQSCEAGECVQGPIPESCAPSDDLIALSRDAIATNEAGLEQTFTVQLTEAPTAHVTVWIVPSDPDEVAVFPQQLHFCLDGYTETDRGCELIEGEGGDDPHWQRVVEVTATGVRDLQDDGDEAYTLDFEVWSDDARFIEATPDPISGINAGIIGDPELGDFDGLADEALVEALHAFTRDHRAFGYMGANSARTILFSTLDVFDGQLESLYTGAHIDAQRGSSLAYQAGFNTEHTWPQGQFDGVEPPKSDLHHIYACDISSNGRRSSYAFGWSSDPDASGSLLSGGNLWQVRPERRGDVARAHFYVAVRYGLDDTLGIDFDDNNVTTDGVITDNEEAVLRQWHVDDPVDDRERQRHHRVAAYQGNRNPFIDHPELVDAISDF